MSLHHMIATLPLSHVFSKEEADHQVERIGDLLTFKGPLGNELGFAEIIDVKTWKVADADAYNVVLKVRTYMATEPGEHVELAAERRRLDKQYADRIAAKYEGRS